MFFRFRCENVLVFEFECFWVYVFGFNHNASKDLIVRALESLTKWELPKMGDPNIVP